MIYTQEQIKKYFEHWNNQPSDYVDTGEMNGFAIHLFTAGFKASDLLPTEKDCPECKGSGWIWEIGRSGHSYPRVECDNCEEGKIPLYYSPEKYEKIMGKPFSEDGMVWVKRIGGWAFTTYAISKKHPFNYKSAIIVIVQTDQGAPPADYREGE